MSSLGSAVSANVEEARHPLSKALRRTTHLGELELDRGQESLRTAREHGHSAETMWRVYSARMQDAVDSDAEIIRYAMERGPDPATNKARDAKAISAPSPPNPVLTGGQAGASRAPALRHAVRVLAHLGLDLSLGGVSKSGYINMMLAGRPRTLSWAIVAPRPTLTPLSPWQPKIHAFIPTSIPSLGVSAEFITFSSDRG